MIPTELLPNFMILGAAKAGTTSLFDILKQHPRVFLPFDKEPMFFSNDDLYRKGLEWYARTYFRKAGRAAARGEASPHYLYWSSKVAFRLRQAYTARRIKFIIIFRDPVARAYSWYWNMVKEGREDQTFKAALEQEEERLRVHHDDLERTGHMTYGYIKGGCYATLLKPYLDLFPKKDLHFLLQEDLEQDFPTTMRALAGHLGIAADYPFKAVRQNKAARARSIPVQRLLREGSPLKSFLKTILPIRLRHAVMYRLLPLNTRQQTYPPMDPTLEGELRTRFAGEVTELQKILDRDLSAWLPR